MPPASKSNSTRRHAAGDEAKGDGPALSPPPWDWLLDPAREAAVFKVDRRSRVWRVDDAAGDRWVVKRFTDPPARQALVSLIGRHPAQREWRRARQLRAAGLPVVPVMGRAVRRVGPGIHRVLVTPYRGITLFAWLAGYDPGARADAARRHAAARQLGAMTAGLLRRGWFHADHKASNLVIDAAGVCRMIDVGGVRPALGRSRRDLARRMFQNLLVNFRQAARGHPRPASVLPTRADRLRVLRAMTAAWPEGAHLLEPLARDQSLG